MQFAVTLSSAILACGFGWVIIPWLWPQARNLGWLLPIGPTLTILLLRFDRSRHGYSELEFYKELFGRVVLLGTGVIVGYVVVFGYIYGDSFFPITVVFTVVISMSIISMICGIYAALRKPRRGRGPNYLRCPKCGYRIDNIPGPSCPECGRSFAAEPDAWETRHMSQTMDANPPKGQRMEMARPPTKDDGK
jgi:hypothetical protein